MFGKINLALGIQSKPQASSQSSNLSNSNANQKPTISNQSKALLSNPSFTHQPVTKPSNKQYKPEAVQANNKTKQITKNTNTNTNSTNTNTNCNKNNTNPTKNNNNNNNSTKNNNNNNKPTSKPSSIESQMQGSKFRILNQLLYTSSSQQAMQHFKQNPQDYITYHEGYRSQSQKWQSKPVNVLIKYFRKCFKQYKDKVICDLGCGEGFLYEGLTREVYEKVSEEGRITEVKNKHSFSGDKILSFDLVAIKPFIQVADIRSLPVEKGSVDVVVFCLSLMGKNYVEFISEAHRILKQQSGELIIAEVQSRSKNWQKFIQMIEMLGFELVNNGVSLSAGRVERQGDEQEGRMERWGKRQDKAGRYFRVLQFVKRSKVEVKKIKHEDKFYGREEIGELSQLLLTECIYKKR